MPTSAAAEPRLGQVQELTRSECFALLANEHLGRVAVTDDRGPVVFPVNFILDRHTVVFRTEAGTKLHAASRGSRVCFEADGIDVAARTGWSVIVRGEITEVTDRAELRPAARAAAAGVGARSQEPLRPDPAGAG